MRFEIMILSALLSGCTSSGVSHIEGGGNWQYVKNLDGESDANMAVLKSDNPADKSGISVISRQQFDEKKFAFLAVFPKNGECSPVLNINNDEFSPDLTRLNDLHGVCQYMIDDSRAEYIAKSLMDTNSVTVNGVDFTTSGFSMVWPKL
ncbi:hypothetical protein [Aeromonas fluvialis]|uniref:hypothetical protein n=1 Tax=Aeromonas fluvialis TaxID=591962 RepID=UPI0005A9FC68|nr:hypothetical protein [Aeromonas fluvialis]